MAGGINKLAIRCVLGYGLPGGSMRLFSQLSRAAVGLAQPYMQQVPGIFPGGKAAGGVMSTIHLYPVRTRLHSLQRDTLHLTLQFTVKFSGRYAITSSKILINLC